MHITPITGYADMINPPRGEPGGPVQWAYHMILPWMTFAILFAALYVRMIRANVLETMNEDYVRTARAKGAPESRVLRSHILRNAMLPIVTMLGMDIGLALGGAVFTETIYGLPGLGRTAIQALNNYDIADRAWGDRLRHDGDDRLQPDRRPAVRLDRPANPTRIAAKCDLMALLEVRDLKTYFRTDDGIVKAVDGVSFRSRRARRSGSSASRARGKSVTCLSIMGLNPRQQHDHERRGDLQGREPADDEPETAAGDPRQRHRDDLPGSDDVAEPGPLDREAAQEAILLHRDVTNKPARARALELLKAVGIPRAERRIDDYPHQFSGGMRQRVMIAMALVNNPDLLIADEPTTALDVTTQAQILDLMNTLQEEFGSAIIMITHDLGVVAEVADEVIVMYAAEVVEQAPVERLFERPHIRTRGACSGRCLVST